MCHPPTSLQRRGIEHKKSDNRLSRVIPLLFSFCMLLLLQSVDGANIVLGQSASFSGPSTTGGVPYTLGLQAAFYESNVSGGVYGRNISLISMDDQYVVAKTWTNTRTLVADPNVVALVGMWGSSQVLNVTSVFKSAGLVSVGPFTGAASFRQTFYPNIINVRAGYNDEALVLLRYFVQVLHFKRFAILYQNDTLGVPPLGVLQSALATMGLTPVLVFPYTNVTTVNYVSLGNNITAANPQAVFMYCVAGFAQNMIAAYYAGGGSTSITFAIASNAADAFRLYLSQHSLPASNVLATQVVPHVLSNTSAAVVKFRAAVDTYSATIGGATGTYDYLSLEGYLIGRAVVEMLKAVQGNLTRASLLDAVYKTRFFQVDDVLMGPLSNDCQFAQSAVGRSSMCNCTQGLRLVSITAIDANYAYYSVVPDTTYPMAECWAPSSLVSRPTQGGVPNPAGYAIDGLQSLGAGFIANGALTVPDLALINTTSLPTPAQNISAIIASSFVSFVFGVYPIEAQSSIFVASGLTGGAIHRDMSIRVVSGGINGATGVYSVRRELLFMAPPLASEIHAVFSMLRSTGICSSVRLVISSAARLDTNLDVACQLSATTYDFPPPTTTTFSDAASLTSAIASATVGEYTLIAGVDTSSLMATAVSAISSAYSTNSELHFGFMFAELAAHWDALPAQSTAAFLGSINFVSPLPLWTNRSSSSFAAKYLSAMSSSTAAVKAHPNAAMGYLIAGLVGYLQARATTLDPTTILNTLYQYSTVSVNDVTLGPFADPLSCDSTNSNPTTHLDGGFESSCGCNNGARKLFIHTPLDVNRGGGAVERKVILSTCYPAYTVVYPAEASATTTIVAAVVAAGGGVLIIVGMVIYCNSGRDNRRAPKDPNEPCAMVFTDIQSSTALWARAPEAMAPALDTHHDVLRQLVAKHKGYEVKTIGDSFMVAFQHATDAASFALEIQTMLFSLQWPPGIDDTYIELAQEAANTDAIFSMSCGSGSAAENSTLMNSVGAAAAAFDAPSPPCNSAAIATTTAAMLPIWDDPITYTKSWNGIRVRVGMHWGFASIKFDPVSKGYDYYGTLVNTAARVEGVGNGGQVLATKDFFDRLEYEAMDLTDVEVVPLGPQPLRGLDAPIPLYQMCPSVLKSRQFNPLRLDIEIDVESESSAAAAGPGTDSSTAQGGDETWEKLFEHIHKRRKDATAHNKESGLTVIHFLQTALKMMPVPFRKDTLHTMAKKWHVKTRNPPNKKEPYDKTMMFDIVLLTTKIAPIAEEAKRAAARYGNAEMGASTASGPFQASVVRRQSMRRQSKLALSALANAATSGLDGLAAATVPTPVSPSLSK